MQQTEIEKAAKEYAISKWGKDYRENGYDLQFNRTVCDYRSGAAWALRQTKVIGSMPDDAAEIWRMYSRTVCKEEAEDGEEVENYYMLKEDFIEAFIDFKSSHPIDEEVEEKKSVYVPCEGCDTSCEHWQPFFCDKP